MTISSIQPIGERYDSLMTVCAAVLPERTAGGPDVCMSLRPRPHEQSLNPLSGLVDPRLPSRRKAEAAPPVSESSEARQKFANAKAISSDMFFGRESGAEVREAAAALGR